MGRYNPNFPTVLGNEFGPVATDPVTIDTATSFGYTFRTTPFEDVVTARVQMTAPPPGQAFRKVVTAEVYPDRGVAATGPMRKIRVGVSSGSSFLNATLINAANYAEALNNPTDNSRVSLTGPLAGVRIHFDTSTSNTKLHSVLQNNRIVDIQVLYAMTGEFSLHPFPITLSMERVSAGVVFDVDTSLTGETLQYDNVVPRRSRLGDYNPFWNTTINPNADFRRGPWVLRNGSNNYTGLEAMQSGAGTNTNLRFLTASTVTPGVAAFSLHYAALEITYCKESRVAAGGIDLSPGVGLFEDMFYADVPLFSPTSWGFPWDSGAGDDYALTVGQGITGVRSLIYPVPVTVDRLVPARDTFRGHRGVILNKTLREGEEWTREEVEAVPAVALYNSTTIFGNSTIYPPSQVYVAPLEATLHQLVFTGQTYQGIDQEQAGNTYTSVRFYARKYALTSDYLEVFLTDDLDAPLGPSARIYPEEFDLLPEIANGWREVTLPLSEPWTTTSSFNRRWQFGSATDSSYPWQVLGADANPYRETGTDGAASVTYGGNVALARVEAVSDSNADITLMFIQDLAVPGNLTVTPAVQPLTVLDPLCGIPTSAIPTGIRYHQLAWEAVNDLAVAGFAHYEIQRRDTTMPADEWETIATVTTVAATDTDDYEARVGVVSSYRIRQVHEDGYVSAWSDTITSTITFPGVTGTDVETGVLILTSNYNPDGNLAYCHVYPDSGVPSQDFAYPEGAQTAYQQMYGRDYQVAFRGLERAGVEFTRNLLINAVGVPALTMDKTPQALRDLAWDTVPYVCTRDELNNRWLTALEVPTSATTAVPTVGHLVIAPVTFVEITATPAPVDALAPCEGLRLEGNDSFQYWDTPAPAQLGGARVQTDTFTRVTANAWGSSDTGQAWTASGGVAADFNTSGTQGRIISSTVTVNRQVVAAPTYGYHRTRVDFTVPAVATGGSYFAGLVTRWVDASNYYAARLEFTTAGNCRMEVVRVVAGALTVVYNGTTITTYTAGTVIHLEIMGRGTTINARVWKDATTRPAWDDDSLPAVAYAPANTALALSGKVGVIQTRAAANTNVNLTVAYDDFTLDSLPVSYDVRALVRPFADQFAVQYGTNDYTNPATDSEGQWNMGIAYSGVYVTSLANGFTEAESTALVALGLVKNRQTWVRALINQDDGTGAFVVQWYTLADDGVTWTLADTTTVAAPTQPLPPLLTDGGLLEIFNTSTGGIWTKRFELRVDGVLVAAPDFEAQAVGTTAFTDAQGNNWSTTSGRGLCATLD